MTQTHEYSQEDFKSYLKKYILILTFSLLSLFFLSFLSLSEMGKVFFFGVLSFLMAIWLYIGISFYSQDWAVVQLKDDKPLWDKLKSILIYAFFFIFPVVFTYIEFERRFLLTRKKRQQLVPSFFKGMALSMVISVIFSLFHGFGPLSFLSRNLETNSHYISKVGLEAYEIFQLKDKLDDKYSIICKESDNKQECLYQYFKKIYEKNTWSSTGTILAFTVFAVQLYDLAKSKKNEKAKISKEKAWTLYNIIRGSFLNELMIDKFRIEKNVALNPLLFAPINMLSVIALFAVEELIIDKYFMTSRLSQLNLLITLDKVYQKHPEYFKHLPNIKQSLQEMRNIVYNKYVPYLEKAELPEDSKKEFEKLMKNKKRE